MVLSIIVAVAENNVIGKNNTLIWHLPADMKFFKEKTTGHVVITGRKNYESIPDKFRPLPNRTNVVITRQVNYEAPGAVVASSIDGALQYVRQYHANEEVFIIGGAEIYRQSIHQCDKLYITRIHHRFDGDAFFPDINEREWKRLHSQTCQPDEKNKYAYTFETWERNGSSK